MPTFMLHIVRVILLLSLLVLMSAWPAAAAGIPRPDLGDMDEAARAKIVSMQASLEQLAARDDVRPAELAEAFGHLGRLFHAYHLRDSAETCYSKSRELAPDDPRWPYYAGMLRHADGEFEAAIEHFERVLSSRPDDLPALLRLGDTLLALGRAAEAREPYARAQELDPRAAAAIYGLGKAAAAAGDHEGAIALFERALELQPGASVIHYPLGQAYRKVGDLDQAREHLSQRGEEEVNFSDPLAEQISRLVMGTAFDIVLSLARSAGDTTDTEFLGFALSYLGDVRGSIQQLEQGLSLKQQADASPLEQGRIHYVLGGLLVNDDRDPEAIQHFSRALELAPELDDARVKLGNALARAGRVDEALDAYSQVLSGDPNHAAALLKRAAALMELDRGAEARPDLERLLTLDPETAEVHVKLATVLEQSGDASAAIERYRAAAELDLGSQERPLVHVKLASLLRQQGDLEDAGMHYLRALDANPRFAPALGGLAGLLAQRGRMHEASSVFATLVEVEPDLLQPRLAEASTLILSDQHGAARKRLEAALEHFPGELQIIDVLARHLAASPDPAVRDGERAVELSLELYRGYSTPQSAETLAMAYAEVGNFVEAVHWQEELIDEIKDEVEAAELVRLRDNLARYQRGESCCAPLRE